MSRGFTIIEVIVVVVILAVVAIIGVSIVSTPSKEVGTGASTVEAAYPEPTNYVVDNANVLSESQYRALTDKLRSMDSSKHQFGVAIVKTTQPLDIEQYSIKLAEKWKVGYKGIDNGAIIVIATQDRKVRIEVGYGLEGDINDAAAGRILDNQMVPFLKDGKWYEAIVAGLDELNNRVK